MAKKSKVHLVTLVAGITVFACGVALVLLVRLVTYDLTIAGTAFGDGHSPITITPETTAKVGQSVILNNFQVTVIDSRKLDNCTDLRTVREGEQCWLVHFTLENVSSDVSEWVNPNIDTEMQYMTNGYYVPVGGTEKGYLASVKGSLELAPGTQVDGELIYIVPQDKRPLYWIYEDSGDWVVFQVSD